MTPAMTELAAEDARLGALGCQFAMVLGPAGELAAEDTRLGALGCQFAMGEV